MGQPICQFNGRDIAAEAEGFAGGDGSEEMPVTVFRIVAGEALGGIVQQRLRLDDPRVERHGIDEWLERGAGGTPGPRPVHLAGNGGIVEIGRSHAGANFSGGGMKENGRGIAQALGAPAFQEIANGLLHGVLLV